MIDMNGKVVIVTGGTRGIGLEIVRTFCESGATVVLFGSREETVLKAVEELKSEGKEVKGYFPDLSDYESVQSVIEEVHHLYGHIDVLVNNAGISANKKIEETTSEDFKNIMDLNVNAIFNTSKAVVSFMKENKGGVILNTSSMVSIYGQPRGVAYPTSKFAVNGLTKSLARELGKDNIRVNAVAPGVTNTDMVSSLPEQYIAPLLKTIPLGRVGEPEEVANAFLFLASDMASYVTGAILSVDGAAIS